MNSTICDTRFVNVLPNEVIALTEKYPSQWDYAMNKTRVLREQMKYRGESMKPAALAELSLNDFGFLLDGFIAMPHDFDLANATNKGATPWAARYSGNIWPSHSSRQSALSRPD